MKIPAKLCGTYKVSITSTKAKAPETQDMIVLSEQGLYRLIMRSNKPEAESFQDWVFEIIKELRQAAGLEGYEIFRMLDKEHQRQQGRKHPLWAPEDDEKADMPPEMLQEDETVLEDVVSLMGLNDRYNMGQCPHL